MKKSIKFLACIFAVSALAVACGNDAENEDTTNVDTPVVIDTIPDTVAVDTVAVVEEPVATKPTKKNNNNKKTVKRTDAKDKFDAERSTDLKRADLAKPGSNALKNEKLKNSDAKGATKDRSGFAKQQ
jgi:hypothetical protein